MDIQDALEFIEARHWGVLITLRKNGRPQASNIGYGVFDEAIHISVTDSRAKTANLRRDNRASFHVTSDDFWKFVVVDGPAELSRVTTDPDDSAAALLRRVYESISGPHPDWDEYDQAMIDQGRLVISIRPDHAYGQV